MSNPVCPTHGTALKVSKFGGWYCSEQNPDGSYCKFKLKAPAQPGAAAPVSTPPSGSTGMPGGEHLAAAALDFAGRVYQGTGKGQEATTLAMTALAAMKAIQ